MTRLRRGWLVGLIGAALVIMVPVATAWACVGLVSLTATPNSVQAGGMVTVAGKEFASKAPVDIHLDTIDGPVLATAPPPTSTMTSQFKIQVTIPADTSTGQHLLIATQTEHNMNGGNPARALIYVGAAAPAGSGVQTASRPDNLLVTSGIGFGALVLIALGAAAVCLFLVGIVYMVVSRRRPSAEAVRA